MFSKAIVRTPCKAMINGLTTADLGKPDYEQALVQHKNYIGALELCGLDVTILPADENFPDSTFIEDTALLTSDFAVITNPGAQSRKGEVNNMFAILKTFYSDIKQINSPGTLEAGDIMMVGSHYYIGISERTSTDGANQLINILNDMGLSGSIVDLEKVLHLKTGVAYLENNNLLACGEFLTKPEFSKFNKIEVGVDENYAANCVWVNGTVLVPAGFPETKKKIENIGYQIIEVDVSEFRKLDGGLSCLSLRF